MNIEISDLINKWEKRLEYYSSNDSYDESDNGIYIGISGCIKDLKYFYNLNKSMSKQKQLYDNIENMHRQLKSYKKCKPHIIRPYDEYFYQSKVKDKKGIMYFINCRVYRWDSQDHFEFEAQFTHNDRSINVSTVNWTGDTKEEFRKYPKLKEIEDMFEKIRRAYGGEYTELF